MSTPDVSPHEQHEPLPEGDEHPPRGVRVMGYVRWLLIAALFAVAALSVARSYGVFTEHATAGTHYHCPMHPEIVSDLPSSCPICGMALVPDEAREEAAEYACPMHPDITSHTPHARCPICGMELVEVAAEKSAPDAAERARIGVRFATVARRALAPVLTAVGSVAVDEARVVRVSARTAGYVESLPVAETYVRVAKDAPLLGLYSPEWVLAQEELLAFLAAPQPSPALVEGARAKLRRLGMAEADLSELATRRAALRVLNVRAPRAGVVTAKSVVLGASVEAGAQLFEITDLSQVWVLAEIAARDARGLRAGMDAQVELAGEALPRTVKVDLVYPELEPERRGVRIRVRLPNPNLSVRPGTAAVLSLRALPEEALSVPETALVQLASGSFVFVRTGEDVLVRRSVTLGTRADGFAAVRSGLREGEEVVSAASFLVDSETRLEHVGDEPAGPVADGGRAP